MRHAYGLFNWRLLVKSMAWRVVNGHKFPHLLKTHIEGGRCNQAEVVPDSSSHLRIYVYDSIHVGSHIRFDQDPFVRRFGGCYTGGQRYCKPAETRITVLLGHHATHLCHHNDFITREVESFDRPSENDFRVTIRVGLEWFR
jgi:hypothetical protein